MTDILAKQSAELDQINDLLDKDVPSYRQAYSDRTAWIMACMSELAYVKFNPLLPKHMNKDCFLEKIADLVGENSRPSLLKLIDLAGYDHAEEKKKLEKELSILRMELVETFDCDGTQAILVSNDKFIVLAFRGTEAMNIKDIKSDLKAKTTQCETGGKIHTGFKEAFEKVGWDIQQKLDENKFPKKPLFITGHGSGGALATVAAKKLSYEDGIAACYTFGSPRVGDEEWVADIKTPFYRLVNAADCVTMLPPGAEIITIFSWVAQYIPWIGRPLKSCLLSNFGGYLHGGNMRYLTNCRNGEYGNVKLLYSVSFFFRLKGWLIFKKLPWKKFLSDHSINIYRKKLEIVARSRN